MATYVMGSSCKLYINEGTYTDPTWTLIENVGDLSLNTQKDKIDASTRRSPNFKAMVPGQGEFTVTFDMIYDPDDTIQSDLQSAYLAKTTEEFLMLDGAVAVAGSAGWRVTTAVFNISTTEPINDVKKVSVEVANTYSDYEPTEYTATS